MFQISACFNGKQWLSIGVTAILLLSACSSDMSDLEQSVAEIKAKENPNVEPLPRFEIVQPFYYTADNSRDPFEPLPLGITPPEPFKRDDGDDEKPKLKCPSPDTNRVRTDLERLPLDVLQMVGTVQEADNLFGLVVSKATGILHKIKVGDYIGQDYGRVINITETEIAVEESVPDGQGCYTRKVNTIALYD